MADGRFGSIQHPQGGARFGDLEYSPLEDTPANLSAAYPLDFAVGQASVRFTSSKAGETAHVVVTHSDQQPTAEQIAAGQDHGSVEAEASGNLMSVAGENEFSGLAIGAGYWYAHIVQGDSNIVSTVEFRVAGQAAGPDEWAFVATTPAGDHVLPPEAEAGDYAFLVLVDGGPITVLNNGSTSSESPSWATASQIWDQSLNGGLGGLSAVWPVSFEAPDLDAPTLSDPSFSDVQFTSVDLGVTTDEGGGTHYWGIYTTPTVPGATAADRRANLKSGVGAVAFGSQPVVDAGEITVDDAGPLPTGGTFYGHQMHEDAVGNASQIISTGPFSTPSQAGFVASVYSNAEVRAAGTWRFTETSITGAIYANEDVTSTIRLPTLVHIRGAVYGTERIEASVRPVGLPIPASRIISGAVRDVEARVSPWITFRTLRRHETIAYEDFLPFILPNVPGAPRDLVVQQLNETVIDFCEFTRQWLFHAAPVDLRAGREVYAVAIPGESEIVQAETVVIAGSEASARDEGERILAPGRLGYSRYRDRFLLFPTPARDLIAGLEVHLSLKPTVDAAGCSEYLFANWRDALVEGALWRLRRIPNKPWTSVEASRDSMDFYLMERARAEADRRGKHDGMPDRMVGRTVIRRRRRWY